jgi:hypothetical protein
MEHNKILNESSFRLYTNKETNQGSSSSAKACKSCKEEVEAISNTVRRRSAHTNQAVQEHESEQRAAAREVPGVQEQEQSANTVRQAIVRTDQGV